MKKKNSKFENSKSTITFNISGFNIQRFTLVEPGLDIITGFDLLKLKLGFTLDFTNNLEQNGFNVIISIIYHYDLNGRDILLLELVLMTGFQFQELNSIIEIDGENFKIPDELLVNLVSLAYSTARGILFSKTQGSFLNQFILPLIDPKILVENHLKQATEIPKSE